MGRTHTVFLAAQHTHNVPAQVRLHGDSGILTILQLIQSPLEGRVQKSTLEITQVTAIYGRGILGVVLRKQFKVHAQVQAVNQSLGHLLHRIHNGCIGVNGHLNVAQKNAVVLGRNGILVGLVEGVHLFFGGAYRTHMALANLHKFDVATDLLGKAVPVLSHAEPQLGADGLFESGKVNILTARQLGQVGVHALVHFGIGHHDRVAVNAGKQHLLLDHLIQHIVLLLLFRHGGTLGGLLELVKVVQELRTHNRLAIYHCGNTLHQHGSGPQGGGKQADKIHKILDFRHHLSFLEKTSV